MAASPKGFAMVPAWLAWKRIEIENPRTKKSEVRGPNGDEVLVYVHVAMAGRMNQGEATYENCLVSKRELSEGNPLTGYPGTGLSISSITRALRGLEKFGAIESDPTKNPDGSEGPRRWRCIFGVVSEPKPPAQPPVSPVTPPRSTGEAPRRSTGDTPPVAPVTPPVEEVNSIREEEDLSLDEDSAAVQAESTRDQSRERSSSSQSNSKPPSKASVVADLAAAARERFPRWGVTVTRRAILAELEHRSVEEVVAAWRRFIVHPRTTSPGFFAHPLEWWDDPTAAPPTVPPQRKPPCQLCDHGWVIDPATSLPLEPAVKCTHKAMAAV